MTSTPAYHDPTWAPGPPPFAMRITEVILLKDQGKASITVVEKLAKPFGVTAATLLE